MWIYLRIPVERCRELARLSNLANHAFKILGFEARCRNWVVGGGPALFQDSQVAARFLGHAREHQHKILATDAARATARDKDSTRRKQLDCRPVEPMVGHQGLV